MNEKQRWCSSREAISLRSTHRSKDKPRALLSDDANFSSETKMYFETYPAGRPRAQEALVKRKEAHRYLLQTAIIFFKDWTVARCPRAFSRAISSATSRKPLPGAL